MNAKSIFAEALEHSDPAERSAFLTQACGENAELRGQVEALLRAYEEAGSFLDQPAAVTEATGDVAPGQWLDPNALPESPLEGVGNRIGQYKLLQQIGEGGMGVVFMAEQQEPVKRMVALKVIKAGMDSAQVIARFEQERQALALMDHPNIAKVLDAGTTASGRPFFVMELVKGIPITKYCDEQRLTPKQRLELFVSVCQAIQHAHQKGIIHRDIKPSNVLIAAYDGRPVPKVIDFGVAKATGQKLTERTLFTGFGGIIGTLEYMSPEQAEFNALDIDTRSDVYALGVLLYELLTGTTPLSRKRISQAAMLEVLRLIREEEPPRPSTRLSESQDSLTAVSAQRRMEPAALVKSIRGEVDWIVMKALDKDRTRRYETANGMARDIQRYLADEPVEAGPPSATYRLRKLAWRHRRGLTVTTAFAVLLIAASVVSAWQAVRAGRARRQAEQREAEAQTAAEEEAKARQLAQRRLEQIGKANDLLAAIFQDLNPRDLNSREVAAANPDLRRQLSQRLMDVADQLDRAGIDDPATLCRLQETLGRTLMMLGQSERERAIALLGDALAVRRTLPDSTAGRMEETTTMLELATAYRVAGKPDKALPLVEEALARWKARFAPEDALVIYAENELGLIYNNLKQPEKAIRLFQAHWGMKKAQVGIDHPNTLAAMHNLGASYLHAGRLDQAVPLLQETLARRVAVHGTDHFVTTRTRSLLANAYLRSKQPEKAVPLLQQVVQQRVRTLGAAHPESRSARAMLADAFRAVGRDADAARLQEQNRKLAEISEEPARRLKQFADHYHELQTKKGAEAAETWEAWDKYAFALGQSGKAAEAAGEYRRLLAAGLRAFRAGNTRAEQWAIDYLQFVANTRHPDAEATASARAILCPNPRPKRPAPEDWKPFDQRWRLGANLLRQKQYREAEVLLLSGYEGLHACRDKIPPKDKGNLALARQYLVQLYEAMSKKDEADKWRNSPK